MPTKEELARWGRRGTRHSQPAAPSPPVQAQQVALPPAPPGQAWSWHPSGMFVLIPVQSQPEPVRQPQNVRSYAPNPVTGYAQPPLPSNVVPFRRASESCQLVPTGVDRFGNPVDGYATFLDGLQDLDPAQVAGRVAFDVNGLVPGEEDQNRLAHLHHPEDVSDRNPNAVARDPVVDARGSRGFLARRTSPLLVPGGAGPSGGD